MSLDQGFFWEQKLKKLADLKKQNWEKILKQKSWPCMS